MSLPENSHVALRGSPPLNISPPFGKVNLISGKDATNDANSDRASQREIMALRRFVAGTRDVCYAINDMQLFGIYYSSLNVTWVSMHV